MNEASYISRSEIQLYNIVYAPIFLTFTASVSTISDSRFDLRYLILLGVGAVTLVIVLILVIVCVWMAVVR